MFLSDGLIFSPLLLEASLYKERKQEDGSFLENKLKESLRLDWKKLRLIASSFCKDVNFERCWSLHSQVPNGGEYFWASHHSSDSKIDLKSDFNFYPYRRTQVAVNVALVLIRDSWNLSNFEENFSTDPCGFCLYVYCTRVADIILGKSLRGFTLLRFLSIVTIFY